MAWRGIGAGKDGKRGWTASWGGTALLASVLAAAVAGLLVWAPWNPQTRPTDNGADPQTAELAHLKMLGRALKLHADEHEGKFPASIAEIHWRQGLAGMDWDGLPAAVSRFHHPDNGKVMDWLYYGGRTENDPPETILVASPVAFGVGKNQRLVTRVDNVTEVIAESEFQRQTAAVP